MTDIKDWTPFDWACVDLGEHIQKCHYCQRGTPCKESQPLREQCRQLDPDKKKAPPKRG